MGCKHPLKAFHVGVKDNGKLELKVRPFRVNHLEFRQGNWRDVYIADRSPYAEKAVYEYDEIPCGKCIGCRLDASKQWANRCLLELGYHDSAYFVTLTYNPEHVPVTWHVDPETGEALSGLSLRKRDLQLFLKRLRRHTGQEIRYFAAGEYGSKTFRPHYHLILFGLKLDDLVLDCKSKLGYNYYSSQTVQDCWSQWIPPSPGDADTKGSYTPLGRVIVADVSWETCAYVARYTAKKNGTQGAEHYAALNLEPPFLVMSRRPGIGAQYYQDHPELFDQAFINVATKDGGRKFTPPLYFSRKLEKDNPAYAQELKDRRKALMDKYHIDRTLNTDLDYLQLLEVEEQELLNRTSVLQRRLE